MAARFFDRSPDAKTFKRGLVAYNHPDFYRRLGEQPDQITALAVNVLVERFGPHCGLSTKRRPSSGSMPLVGRGVARHMRPSGPTLTLIGA